MNWNLSRREYFADLYVVPVFVLGAAGPAVFGRSSNVSLFGAAAAGFVIWTLAEYVLHRWVFHVFHRREHGRHHARPTEWIGVKPWVSVASLAVVAAGAVAGAPAIDLGCAAFIGFSVGYYTYLSVHALIHHSPSGWVNHQRSGHLLHHRCARVNYGVTSFFWDRIFGTYAPA